MRTNKGHNTEPWGEGGGTIFNFSQSWCCNIIILIIQQCSLISTGQIGFVTFIQLNSYAAEFMFSLIVFCD